MNQRITPYYWMAECRTCGKQWFTRNAHAVGARHARATGHYVNGEIGLMFYYNRPPESNEPPTKLSPTF